MAKRVESQPKDKLDVLIEVSNKQSELLVNLTNALQGLVSNLTKHPVVPTIEEETPKKSKRGRPKKTAKAEQIKAPEVPKINKLNGKPWVDFGTLPESKRNRNDTAIDKKLWGKNQPVERRQASSRIPINCAGCGKQCKVVPEEVGEGSTYKCNQCIVKGQGGR
jgi:hypothetical protein